jgi:Flp pilus assembly pilin Flp
MKKKNKGQSLIEYTVLLGLMLVAALGVVLALRKAIMSRVSSVSKSIAGTTSDDRFDFDGTLEAYDEQTWLEEN